MLHLPLPLHPKPKLKHIDGSLWEASWNKDIGFSLFDRSRPFFFRQLKPNTDRRWWCPWRPKWKRTGETWEGEKPEASGFSVLG